MSITFDLPSSIEQSLRSQLGDLNQAAKEATVVELYRQGKITRAQLSQSLSLGRIETDALLKTHNVTEDLPTDDDIRQDVENLRKILDR